MGPLLITLFASSRFMNLIIIVEANFVSVALNSYLIYLISIFSIKGLLLYNSLALILLNFSISIKLVLILYIRILYISSYILVPLLIRFIQLFTNYFKASALFLFNILILRSLLLNQLVNIIRICLIYLFLLYLITRLMQFYKFLEFLAQRLSIVDRSIIFTIISYYT